MATQKPLKSKQNKIKEAHDGLLLNEVTTHYHSIRAVVMSFFYYNLSFILFTIPFTGVVAGSISIDF